MNFAGVDIGTTHCKGVVLSVTGNVLFEEKHSYDFKETSNEHFEQDPDIIFQTVLEVFQKLIRFCSQTNMPACFCFSGAMHSLIAIDEAGKPITHAFTWTDSRSKKYAAELLQQEAENEIYKHTGTPIHPMSPLCKIIWLRYEMPELFRNTHKFISIKEYIFSRLFGKYVVDYSIASATGLFDIYNGAWYDKALHVAGITRHQLSTPVPPVFSDLKLKDEYKNLADSGASFTVITGGSDGCLANLGCGAIAPHEAALTIGTSGAIRMVTTRPEPDIRQRLFNYILSDKLYITGGPINNGGIVLKWFAENILERSFQTANDFEWFSSLAQHAQAGSNGLIFLPYIAGERAPIWDADARGIFFGLTSAHAREHLMRSIMEGICFSLHHVMSAVEERQGTIETIYATGGFIQSSFWLQLLTDILNKKIIVTSEHDASAVGAALFGIYATGNITDLKKIKEFIPAGRVLTPDSATNAFYQSHISIFRSLYPKLKEEFRMINRQ